MSKEELRRRSKLMVTEQVFHLGFYLFGVVKWYDPAKPDIIHIEFVGHEGYKEEFKTHPNNICLVEDIPENILKIVKSRNAVN